MAEEITSWNLFFLKGLCLALLSPRLIGIIIYSDFSDLKQSREKQISFHLNSLEVSLGFLFQTDFVCVCVLVCEKKIGTSDL